MSASTPQSDIALRIAAQRRSSSAFDTGLNNLSFISRSPRSNATRGRSNSMEGAKPIDEFADADGNWRIGAKSDRLAQVLHVRAGFPYVARLHRHRFSDRLLAKRSFKQVHHLRKIDRGVISDVIDTPGRAARCRI